MAKLKPRARIIRTIGDQLISGPEAALIELVKNAYDADSTSVLIKISPSNGVTPAEIVVCDDGHGMTEEEIVNRWFEPATNEKAKRKLSPKGRIMLGAKGIGRFAASRLGDLTTVRSWTASNGNSLLTTVKVDWRQFTADVYLDSIDIPIESQIVDTTRSGVEITISGLRDTWTKARMERLIRELRRVASPSEVSHEFSMHLDIGDFTQTNGGFSGSHLLSESNRDYLSDSEFDTDATKIIPFAVSNYSDYSLTGEFDSAGNFNGTFVNHRADAKQIPIKIPAPSTDFTASCGPLQVSINVYDREHDAIEALFRRAGLDFGSIGIRLARQILTDNSGISIFRDGFRIRPYGEPENDWLELERQRVQNPSRKLGLSQVSGRVYIANEAVSQLIERSSREGLEHGDSFERLKELIQNSINHIEARRHEFREKAGLSRKAQGDVERTKNLAQLPRIRKEIDRTPQPYADKLRIAVEKDYSELALSLDEIDAYQKLLQSRAALGLVVSQVIHEARRLLNPMASAARSLAEDSDQLLLQTKLGELARKHLPHNVQTLAEGTKSLSNLIKRLDPLSGRKRGRPTKFEVASVINVSLGLMREELSRRSIRVIEKIPTDMWAAGYKEDLQSALLNVLENAMHWSRAGGNPDPEIKISAYKSNDFIDIEIGNSGPPIDPTYIPRLFDAGFSLKSDGTGLGLAIAREASRASKGDLVYIDNADQTVFKISFPISN
jgi:signal transduction histidine kinase